jgi:glycosyltransferase involved in cell wall biosynthesis
LNILFFIHSLSSGGAERVTATLANHWASKGWSITVVTVTESARDFYSLDSRVRRITLNMAGISRSPLHAIFNNAARVSALQRVLRHEKPDVAIAMMTTSNVTLAIAGRVARVYTIGSERTYPPAMPLGRFWEFLRRKTYPWLDALVAQTQEGKDWLAENAPAKTFAVVPNPVCFPMPPQPPVVAPGEVITTLGCKKVLLAVGRLGEEKRFERLITAFSRLVCKHSDWGLVILGQGALMNTLQKQIADLNLQHKIALPGAVGNVGDWFNSADIYALTSRFEGFPNTLVEALAHGVPSVAVDCQTGPREILRHEIDGLLVPQDNLDELINALDRLMADPALRASFSEKAIEVRERYSVDCVAGQWEDIFREWA